MNICLSAAPILPGASHTWDFVIHFVGRHISKSRRVDYERGLIPIRAGGKKRRVGGWAECKTKAAGRSGWSLRAADLSGAPTMT